MMRCQYQRQRSYLVTHCSVISSCQQICRLVLLTKARRCWSRARSAQASVAAVGWCAPHTVAHSQQTHTDPLHCIYRARTSTFVSLLALPNTNIDWSTASTRTRPPPPNASASLPCTRRAVPSSPISRPHPVSHKPRTHKRERLPEQPTASCLCDLSTLACPAVGGGGAGRGARGRAEHAHLGDR